MTEAVWSDDGEGVLTLRGDIGCSAGMMGSHCDGDTAEWALEADGVEIVRVGEDDWLDSGFSLFWMRSQGYAVVRMWEGGVEVRDDATGERLWGDRGLNLAAVPSPDGKVIAIVRQENRDTDGDGYADVTEPWVDMRDPRSGQVLSRTPLDAVWSNVNVPFPFTWTPSERFVVRTGYGAQLAVDPNGRAESVEEPGCWYPVTTSSPWNSAGEEAPASIDPGRSPKVFGCQE